MAIKQYKKHQDVPKKYTWDIPSLLEGKTPEFLIKEIATDFKKLITIKNSKYDSPEAYLKAHSFSKKLEIKKNKLNNYLSNMTSQNVVDSTIASYVQQYNFKMHKLSLEMGSQLNIFYKNTSKIKKWIKLPEFKNLRKSLQFALDNKKYKLNDTIEDYINKSARGNISADGPFSILLNSEIEFGFATSSNGSKIKITRANLSKLSKSNDKMIRKTAIVERNKAHFKHRELFSNLLFQHIKSLTSEAQVRGYKSTIDMLIQSDKADRKLLEVMYDAAKKNKIIFKKFKTYYKKFYFAKFNEKFTKYDGGRELIKGKSEYTVDEAQKLVIDATKPFGKEYNDKIKESFKQRWIDFMPIDNKRSGAYSIGGTYGLDKKFILMNFNGTLDSVSTLAHELGHSMHSYYSTKVQPQELSSYPIFIAEIASIFNELMLNDYLIKNSQNDKMKFKILESTITGFSGTVMRQLEWSNYEYKLYDAIEKGEPMSTFDAISKLYFENQKEYSNKKNMKYNKKDLIAAVTVPHFYYHFYVYKYAIGQLVANIFFTKYKLEGRSALQTFINRFLSAGGKDWPIEILKESGIDLYNPQTYQLGFNGVKDQINEWIKLGKKLFNVK